MALRAQLRHGEEPLVVRARVLPRQLERRARHAALVDAVARERRLGGRAAREAVFPPVFRGEPRLLLRLEGGGGLRGGGALHAVDADDPVLGGEGLLEVLQVDVLLLGGIPRGRAYADDGAAVEVVAGLLVVVEAHLAEAVVGEAVEEGVSHGGRGVGVDAILPRVEEVGLLDVVGVHAGGDADHPEELVDVVAAVADETAEDHEDVVDVEAAENGVRLLFGGSEGLRVRRGRERSDTRPTVAMCGLFQVLLSTITVRLPMPAIW